MSNVHIPRMSGKAAAVEAAAPRGLLPLSALPAGAWQDEHGIWHFAGGMAAEVTEEEMEEVEES